MMFLLDTNVVSELRKAKSGKADPGVCQWASDVAPTSLFLSTISVLELEMGVLRMEHRDSTQGAVLRMWMEDHVLPAFTDRILPIDVAVARCCAGLHIPDPRSDRNALIAATARIHGLTVVTRNVKDFAPTGVSVLNPWAVD